MCGPLPQCTIAFLTARPSPTLPLRCVVWARCKPGFVIDWRQSCTGIFPADTTVASSQQTRMNARSSTCKVNCKSKSVSGLRREDKHCEDLTSSPRCKSGWINLALPHKAIESEGGAYWTGPRGKVTGKELKEMTWNQGATPGYKKYDYKLVPCIAALRPATQRTAYTHTHTQLLLPQQPWPTAAILPLAHVRMRTLAACRFDSLHRVREPPDRRPGELYKPKRQNRYYV